MDFDMNTKQNPRFYSFLTGLIINLNPLVQPESSETVLRCANQLLYIHQVLMNDYPVDSPAIILVKRLEDISLLLVELPAPLTIHQINILNHCINRIKNINNGLKALYSLDIYTLEIDCVMLALEYELENL